MSLYRIRGCVVLALFLLGCETGTTSELPPPAPPPPRADFVGWFDPGKRVWVETKERHLIPGTHEPVIGPPAPPTCHACFLRGEMVRCPDGCREKAWNENEGYLGVVTSSITLWGPEQEAGRRALYDYQRRHRVERGPFSTQHNGIEVTIDESFWRRAKKDGTRIIYGEDWALTLPPGQRFCDYFFRLGLDIPTQRPRYLPAKTFEMIWEAAPDEPSPSDG